MECAGRALCPRCTDDHPCASTSPPPFRRELWPGTRRGTPGGNRLPLDPDARYSPRVEMASAPLAPADRSAPAAPPAGQRRERRYFPELESLRGIAISQVFAMHSSGWILGVFAMHSSGWILGGLAGSSSLLVALVMSDRLGVDLFFVLSAFLLSLPFLEDAAGGPRVPVRRYFERRVLRILPAYYVAVVVGTVLTAR